MNQKILRKKLRIVTFFLGPFFICTTLFSSFLLLNSKADLPFALQLAENSPQSLPNYLKYSLFSQAPPEGQVLGESITALDGKTSLLQKYLEWQHSPLAPHAATFIQVAQKYQLPWTLLPAICGKESTFGKQIPQDSYNCWGWGIYGNQVKKFSNWDEGIEAVGKGLRENYFNNGIDTIEEIEYSYTPPSANSDHHWLEGIKYFQWEIGNFTNLEK